MPTYNDSALTYDAGTTSYDGDPGAIAGLPQCVIEIGFDDGPYVSEPAWTDVTEYVRSVTVRRGRSDDLSPFVGTATVELDNRDRRFDPFNTSSVYNGKLVPRRQIRIRAAAGASTYPVFRGYVAGWPVSYTDAGFDSTVTVECFDALAFVAAETTPDTWLSNYTLSLNPYRYIKFNEPIPAQFTSGNLTIPFKDYGSNPINLGNGSGISSGGSLLPASPSSLDAMVGTIQDNSGAPFIKNFTEISVAGWMKFYTGTLITGVLVTDGDISINIRNERASYTATPYLYFSVRKSGVAIRTYATTVSLTDDLILHIACTYNLTTDTFVAYINGNPITVTTTLGGVSSTSARYISATLMSIAELSLYDYVLTPAQVTLLYQYSTQELGEQVQSRMTRLFRTTPFPENASPSGDFNIWEAPLATQFIQGLQNDNPISSELAVLNSGEGGELFTSREGVIYLTGRDTQNYSSAFLPYDPVTPQVTFSDQAGTALLPFGPSLDVGYNADDIINDLSVTFTGGGSIVVSDTDSINENGKRSATITTSLTGPTGAGSPQDLAANRLEYFRHVIPKVSPLDVGMTRRLTDWQRILDLELMDCFSVQRTPSVGSALDFRLLVQAIEHQIIPGDWRVRITGSARYSNWFTADVDFADGDRLAV
jgi:hypothetical protein